MFNFADNVLTLDHICIAVEKIEHALPLYRDLLGGKFLMGGDVPDKGFRMVQFVYPNGSKIEILEPLGENSFLHKFLCERGPGLHHMTFKVKHIEQMATELKAKGYKVVGENYGNPHWKELFISPPSASGTVVQLAESDRTGDAEHRPSATLEFGRRMRGQ